MYIFPPNNVEFLNHLLVNLSFTWTLLSLLGFVLIRVHPVLWICVVIVGQLDIVTCVTGSPPIKKVVAVGGVGCVPCELGRDDVDGMGLVGRLHREPEMALLDSVSSWASNWASQEAVWWSAAVWEVHSSRSWITGSLCRMSSVKLSNVRAGLVMWQLGSAWKPMAKLSFSQPRPSKTKAWAMLVGLGQLRLGFS